LGLDFIFLSRFILLLYLGLILDLDFFFLDFVSDKFLDLGNTQNIISSASYLTVKTISTELQKYPINKVLISGGGINNNFITEKLKEVNPDIVFSDHQQCGIMSQYKEAILFSLLAYTSYNRMANNVPSSTGAKATSILGKISYA
jgi:anhydro-N-acetylmuramic acid kinase